MSEPAAFTSALPDCDVDGPVVPISARVIKALGIALSRRKQGVESLGSANEIKRLLQEHQFVSNNCPINVYGQA
jgi:hypothetical protein